MNKSRGEGGFTVVELLVYLVIAVIIVGGIYSVMIAQNRLYVKQRELQDVRGTLRSAGNLLAFELRQASATNGDLYSIGTNSFGVRSLQGAGVVCGIHSNGSRFGLYATGGEFDLQAGDSALLFAAGGSGTGDDVWLVMEVDSLYTGSSGVPFCSWGDTATIATERVIDLDSIAGIGGVTVGAPLRVHRRVEYGLYVDGGRYWLGRKVGSAASYTKLIGPLLPPSDSGLVFTYYDQSGAVTGTVTDVRMVQILMRGESYGKAPSAGAPKAQEDTLSLRVSLRG